MSVLANRSGRKQAVKQTQVANDLRQSIVRGVLLPGSRLPVRRELEQRFQVSTITVQRALDALVEDGFVQTNGSQGTYVREDLPHLSRIGLVFPYRSSAPGRWPQFWTALMQEASRLETAGVRKLPFFYDASDAHGSAADFTRLCHVVERDLVGGLIFVGGYSGFAGTPVLEKPGIARVYIGASGSGMPSVSPDSESFFTKAIEHLASAGRRRLAILGVPGLAERAAQVCACAVEHGLECRPQWLQTGDPHRPEYTRPLAHLLMDRPPGERPDALIISDDNLVEHALGGVLAAEVRVPQELSVVAHCNFPYPTPSAVPITRLGYDARELLAVALARIGETRAGASCPAHTFVKATFEAELVNSLS